MKIEFECPQCRSMLRLDAVHGGHQALCPVCGNAVMVPLAGVQPTAPQGESGWQPLGPGNRDIDFRSEQAPAQQTEFSSQQTPWTSTSQQTVQAWSNGYGQPTNTKDGLWTMGLVCGIISVALHVTFCGCGNFLGPLVAIAGLIATCFSRQGSKKPLIILNGIGLLIGLLMLGLLFAALAFAH